MKVLIVSGGGNSKGITAQICDMVMEGLKSSGATVTFIDLTQCNIGFCTGCNRCRETGKCYIKDDMDRLMEKMSTSDLFILATPIRFSGTSSMTKKFMERFQPYWHMSDVKPFGRMAGIICGGSHNPNFDNVIHEFKSLSITMGRKWSGELRIDSTDTADKDSYRGKCVEWGKMMADHPKN
jgi:multimeric flavodoxin WrbA